MIKLQMLLVSSTLLACSAHPHSSTDENSGGSSAMSTAGTPGTSASSGDASGSAGSGEAATAGGGSGATAGAGGSAGSASAGAEATLAGDWQASGMQTLACAGDAPTNDVIDGVVSLTPAGAGMLKTQRSGCAIFLDLDPEDMTAHYSPGQTCKGGNPSVIAFDISYDATSVFTLVDAGHATWLEKSSVRFFNTASSFTCTSTMTGQLGR